MQDASGVDLDQFRRWYSQAGTPVVTVRGAYDAADRTYALHVTQHLPATPGQPSKLPLHIPLAVGLVGPDGRDMPLSRDKVTDDDDTFRPLVAQDYCLTWEAGRDGAIIDYRILLNRSQR